MTAEPSIQKNEKPLPIILPGIISTPIHLLVTHGHLDHNFGNDTIYQAFGLKPEVAQADEHLMKTCSIKLSHSIR